MKFKFDENLCRRAVELFAEAGHDVATVASEVHFSAADEDLIATCRRERRCLVTLDLDFSNPLLFKPSEYAGIAVLRLPRKPSHDDLLAAVQTLIGGLAQGNIDGRLSIVQKGRIKEYQEEVAEWWESTMPKDEMIIHWSEEDQAFIAEVPELPGCAVDGRTYQEAWANAEIVVQEWIETAKELVSPVPQPKGRLVFA
jgi:predicted RNase H-like HicB family nuclease